MLNCIIVRYGEIGTKSAQTRRWFEGILVNNIREALINEGIEYKRIDVKKGRITIRTNNAKEGVSVLRRVFGIVSLSPAMEVEAKLEKINKAALKLFRKRKRELGLEEPRFRVSARRITKDFPLKSPEIPAKIGEHILKKEPSKVDLHEYDIEVGIEVMEGRAYIFVDKIRGFGGLPIGTQGKVVALLSGGIHSAVASFLMMKRGVEVIPIHIHIGEEELERVRRVWRQLKKYAYGSKSELIVIKPGQILQKLEELGGEEYIPVFHKFMMIRHADRTARDFGAKGIVTGDKYQPAGEMYIMNQASDLPIYMPLIGMDKDEIELMAREIGIFDAEEDIPLARKCPTWEEFKRIYEELSGEKLDKREC